MTDTGADGPRHRIQVHLVARKFINHLLTNHGRFSCVCGEGRVVVVKVFLEGYHFWRGWARPGLGEGSLWKSTFARVVFFNKCDLIGE